MFRLESLAFAFLVLLGCEFHPECGSDTEDGAAYDGPMCQSRVVRELRVSSKFSPEQQEAIIAWL
jgi:hypothetical protein